MVDRQKALLMVLLALLIYPNDIFGKFSSLSFRNLNEYMGRRRKKGNFDQFVLTVRLYPRKLAKTDRKAIPEKQD